MGGETEFSLSIFEQEKLDCQAGICLRAEALA